MATSAGITKIMTMKWIAFLVLPIVCLICKEIFLFCRRKVFIFYELKKIEQSGDMDMFLKFRDIENAKKKKGKKYKK